MFADRINGAVSGLYPTRQYDGQEELGDSHPDLLGYYLKARKRDRLLEVAAELAKRNAAGFVYQGKPYQLDDTSQARITALVVKADRFLAALPGATWSGKFIAADNSENTFTAAEFAAFAEAASDVVIARRLYAREVKNTILAAADVAALDAINVSAGWPS
jgi:hypothetical protein